eukprot:jgi/Undpi1/8959/HiC_scaffold_26.g11420.m1
MLRLAVGEAGLVTKVIVENLAMVDSVQVELGRGLIAITGETGAGKSLISSAFSLAAGARVRGADMVGNKGPTATVQLHLELGEGHRASTAKLLKQFGVPVEDDGRRLKVARTVGGKGSSASVNGCSIKVGNLRELMSPLIYTVDANAFELFSRADGRLRALDRMLTPAEVVLAEKVRWVVSQLKQAEACRVKLEQKSRFEGGPGGEEDASLLHHLVEELDEFRRDEAVFIDKMRVVVNDFVDDWGEEALGPLAEPFLSGTTSGDDDGDSDDATSGGGGCEELSELWPRLSQIHEGMEDLEASRTKVDLARQIAVDGSNPESIVHAVGKIRGLLIDAEDENVGLSQQLLEDTHEDLNSLEECVKRLGPGFGGGSDRQNLGFYTPLISFSAEKIAAMVLIQRALFRARTGLVNADDMASAAKSFAQLRFIAARITIVVRKRPPARPRAPSRRAGDKLERSVASLPVLPITLEEVEERTAKWKDLSRKHGVPPERLGSMQKELRVELDELVLAAEALPLAIEKENALRLVAGQVAGKLSAVRRREAIRVERLINPMMADVGLEGTAVKVLVEEAKALGPTGADRVQFVMEANQGQTRGTVDAVASSGEKSRLLLLLETLLPPPQARPSVELDRWTASMDRGIGQDEEAYDAAILLGADEGSGGTRMAPCAVLYDEIDAHVGGRTAVAVGSLLANQGRDSQVVVVTHTASVAALADQHLVVDKATADARAAGASAGTARPPPTADDATMSAWQSCRHDNIGDGEGGLSVAIREVQGREREEEVARMAAGDMGGGAASELAREMLRYSGRRQGSAAAETPQ